MKSNSPTGVGVLPPFSEEDLASDEFFKDLEVAFDQIQIDIDEKKTTFNRKKRRGSPRTAETGELVVLESNPISDMHQTFLELVQSHLVPVARYVKAVRMGIHTKDILEVIALIVEPLAKKTKKVGLDDHAKELRAFLRTVKSLMKQTGSKISESDASALTFAFAPVGKLFEVKTRGHSTAVLNVVAFYQTLRKAQSVQFADIKKLFAIGLSSLTMLRQTSLEELSSLTGIRRERIKVLRSLARKFTLFELV